MCSARTTETGGCFCGLNFPNLPTSGNGSPASLSASEREAIIAEYYSIRPIDDIDSVCRDHDVCWILRGDGDGRCNDEFRERLRFVRWAMLNAAFRQAKLIYQRCSVLAGDMETAFLTIGVTEHYEEPGKTAESWIGRAVGTMFLVPALAIFRPIIWTYKPYPQADERCVTPTEP
jgi:hypothetical protein